MTTSRSAPRPRVSVRRKGFATVSAGSLSELASVLMTSAPDLALVDIELPQIPGHRLGALIRSRQDIPIVLVSALDENHVRRLFEASDADGWICKPLTRDKLIGAVTRFVVGRKRQAGVAEEAAIANDATPGIGARAPGGRRADDHGPHRDGAERQLYGRAGHGRRTPPSSTSRRGNTTASCSTSCSRTLSGFDVLRHIVLRRGELLKRTFIMTAASDESLQFIDRAAVAGVLRKPFEVATLPELVTRLVRA